LKNLSVKTPVKYDLKPSQKIIIWSGTAIVKEVIPQRRSDEFNGQTKELIFEPTKENPCKGMTIFNTDYVTVIED